MGQLSAAQTLGPGGLGCPDAPALRLGSLATQTLCCCNLSKQVQREGVWASDVFPFMFVLGEFPLFTEVNLRK